MNKKILLLKIGAIGDTIMTTPLVRQLRKNFPDAQIDYWIGKVSSQVLINNPYVSNIHCLDEMVFLKKNIPKVLQTAYAIKKENYDVVFVLDRHLGSNIFSRISGIKTRIGLDRHGEGKFLTYKIHFDGKKHEIIYYLNLLEAANLKVDYSDIKPEIFLTKNDIEYSKSIIKQHKLKNYICICPGGANNPGQKAFTKLWPSERYSELINRLLSKYKNINIVLLGDNNDVIISDFILGNIDSKQTKKIIDKRITNLTGQTTIHETAAIMKSAKLILCNDTGAMHIASCVNEKVMSIFGPTDPKRFAPLNKKSIYLWHAHKPCNDIYGNFNCNDKCIEKVTVNEVFDVIRKRLDDHMYKTNIIYWPILLIIDILGYILFFWKKLYSMPTIPKKVLFIRLEHIGDMIMATPVFENWKKNYPDCEIHILCRPLTKPVIENNPFVDKISTFEPPWFIRKSGEQQSTSYLIKQLRKENYDIVFEMHGDPRNNYIASTAGKYSIGYGCRGFGFLLNKLIPYKNQQMVKQNLELIKPLCKIRTTNTTIFTGKQSVINANKILKKYSLKNKSFIIINPLSGRKEKDLTESEVKDFISKYSKYKIVFTGSNAEKEFNSKFANKNIVNISGQTDLLTLTELVRKAKLVISPDTAIVHIAHSVNTECLTMYKTTDKKIWGY